MVVNGKASQIVCEVDSSLPILQRKPRLKETASCHDRLIALLVTQGGDVYRGPSLLLPPAPIPGNVEVVYKLRNIVILDLQNQFSAQMTF
jgi:hypothetical protein